MTGVLDSILATLAVVLGLSLIVQAVQQIFKQWLDLKSVYMRFRLLAMFDHEIGGKEIVQRGLRKVKALADQASPHAKAIVQGIEDALKSYGYKNLELLEQIDAQKLKEIVGTIQWKNIPGAEDVTRKLGSINADIDRWFELAKNGFQDLYERRMKVWSFITSLIVVVALNANIFSVYHQFSSNGALRDAALEWAGQYSVAPQDTGAAPATMSDSAIVASIRQNVDSVRAILGAEGFQVLGWKSDSTEPVGSESHLLHWLMMVCGWLAMTLLVSLGAPFWYDMLKTLLGLKNAVGKGKASGKGQNDTNQSGSGIEAAAGNPAVG